MIKMINDKNKNDKNDKNACMRNAPLTFVNAPPPQSCPFLLPGS